MLSTSLPLDVRGFLEGGEALLMVIGKCCRRFRPTADYDSTQNSSSAVVAKELWPNLHFGGKEKASICAEQYEVKARDTS